MHLLAKTRLLPKPTAYNALFATLTEFNQAREYVASVARSEPPNYGYWRQRDLYKATYEALGARFDLGSQSRVLIINEIAGYAQRMEVHQAKFGPYDPILYDERVLSWQFDAQTVSIWTMQGRKKGVPFECGPRQREVLAQRRLVSELIYFNDEFYLFTQCRVNQVSSVDVEEVWK